MKKIFTLIALGCSVMALAQPAGWTVSTPITIANTTGNTVTDYQVRLTLNTQTPITNNQMQANGADIRFGKECNGTTLYNHWIESGINTGSTVIWVKVDTLYANSTRTIYWYYGNNSALPASAVIGTFVGPHSSTDSVTTANSGGVANSQRGFRFAPNEDVIVYALGKKEPNGTTRYITLFNFATQAIVYQGQVSGAAGQFNYSPVANPFWITSGTQYVLELYQGAGDGYYFGNSSQIGQHLTYYDMRYCNSCTQNTFPTSILTNFHYGYPDMWYFTKNNAIQQNQLTVNVGASSAGINILASAPQTICSGDSLTVGVATLSGNAPYTYSWSGPVLNASSDTTLAFPTSTSTLVCTVTDACGATGTGSVVVVVDQPSLAGNISVDTAICAGTGVNMSTSGSNGNVIWYEYNGSTYTPLGSGTSYTSTPYNTTGTYTFVAIATNGVCSSDTSVFALTNVNSVANAGTVTTSPAVTELCAFDTINFVTTGSTGNIVWMMSPDSGMTWVNFGNGPVYNPGAPNNGDVGYYMFMAVASSSFCGADSSAVFSIDVRPTPVVFVGNDTTLCGNSLTLDAGNPGEVYLWSNGDTTQTSTVTGSGTYLVTVTNQYGCSGRDTIGVNINNNPVINLGADTASCGNAILLDAQIAGANYLWNDNSTGQTLSASTSGTYYVTVTDNNTCSGSDTINVTINTPPTVTASASATTVCADDANVALTGSPAGGTWNGPGVTGNSFDPSVGAGVQNLIYLYTDTNGCEGSAGVSITVNACVGITENNATAFHVFPVPFQNAITITTDNAGEYRVRMMNAAGQVVMENEFNGNITEIQTETLAAGLYWIEIAGANGTQIFKVTK